MAPPPYAGEVGGEDGAARPSVRSLEHVPGVTPIYAALLREGGIVDVATLGAADPARVVEAVSAPGVLPITRATAESWVREAARLDVS